MDRRVAWIILTTVTVFKNSHVHIIGAGIAGLAAAVHLSQESQSISIYESAPRAGGRCRSFHDPQLGCTIDNGNHLMMGGNYAILEYLSLIGASDQLIGASDKTFPFVDLTTNEHWCLKPSAGPIPWWIFDASRRVPKTSPWDYFSALRILDAKPQETVADCVGTKGSLYRNFWEPLTLAVLNTDPRKAAAKLMRPVLMETFLRGSQACRPLVARHCLADTLIEPAIKLLTGRGANIRFGARIKAFTYTGNRISSLELDSKSIVVAPSDIVILAVPPWIAETLVPDLNVPPPGEPILNVHYRLPNIPTLDETFRIIGVIGGTAHWIFVRKNLASVTISAANGMIDQTTDFITRTCWQDVERALNLASPEPPSRVVKERRATFAQTTDTLSFRPKTVTNYANLLIAGDWTATGIPATIEGAVRSGFQAATFVAKHHSKTTSSPPN